MVSECKPYILEIRNNSSFLKQKYCHFLDWRMFACIRSESKHFLEAFTLKHHSETRQIKASNKKYIFMQKYISKLTLLFHRSDIEHTSKRHRTYPCQKEVI
jgi:hypothetical protein